MFSATDGLATLSEKALLVQDSLENRILGWARECGAERYAFPPLLRIGDLARFDYFRNFPHLALVAAPLKADCIEQDYASSESVKTIPAEHLSEGRYALPSAACYGVYLHFKNTEQPRPRYVTTVARCFRNEEHYEELRRLWGFTMREIVCIGTQEAAQEHLRAFKRTIADFASQLGLKLEVKVATDPFYDRKSSRAALQTLFPVKEEFVYSGSLAIASVNFHRNFFGERCNIRTADGQYAFTSCVAFGLERWLSALTDRFDGDEAAIRRALGNG